MATRTRSSKKTELVSAEVIDIEAENDTEAEEEDEEEEETEAEEEEGSSSKRLRKNEEPSEYEQIRDQRMRENKERMQKLGLLNLSQNLKTLHKNKNPQSKPQKKITQSPTRRSSRIMTLAPVSYVEPKVRGKKDSSIKDEDDEGDEIFIPEGENPESYTEEQVKLLGDSDTVWELGVDGFDEDGYRMYDSVKGETCHQCRQKTLCQHTSCNKCELPQGQLCGDCLYTRYGENLLEVDANPKWTCPSCRGICNCSRCRKANGWMPTGNIYRKVSKLGFKSVAHYLIQTRCTEKSLEEVSAAESVAEEISQSSTGTNQNRVVGTRRSLRSR
ncbi:hypothetical protein PIB30_030292 [Stylosanthes scabra]|uniref:Zinc-finger domain-containing protein n=1 Tax=Stylosanthes scabra TaxID=79078 RepID=A0ABU6QC35_9FABA|nr:hypothetical protein [Stylosanthes scabra]